MIEFDKVGKDVPQWFQRTEGCQFKDRAGRICGDHWPSGAGKSTLLRDH